MTLPDTSHNIFASIIARPQGVHYQAQHADEQIYLLLRDHVITQLGWIASVIFFAIVPLFGLPLVYMIAPRLMAGLGPLYTLVFLVFWYLVIFLYAFEKFLLWFFGVYIVSSDRIVDIDFHNFFQKDFAESQVNRIQDVTSTMNGPLQVMFNYGHVTVQTAGDVTNIEFENVPMPDKISRIINDLVSEQAGSFVPQTTRKLS